MLSTRVRLISSKIYAAKNTNKPYQHSMRSISTSLLIPTQLDNLLGRAWVRHHLFVLGYDLIKLNVYRKLSHLLEVGGGGTLKNMVFDLSTFIKKELQSTSPTTLAGEKLKDLVYLSSNSNLYLRIYNEEEHIICNTHRFSDFKWFFTAVGYMILLQSENAIEELTDKIIDIYFTSTQNKIMNESLRKEKTKDSEIYQMLREYYKNVPINYGKLYNREFKYITMHESNDYKIGLPELPRIKNKELLTKSLIHKELYRALVNPDHSFGKELIARNFELNSSSFNILKYDLSFLDGLGDFYLAREASSLLYKFRNLIPNNNDNLFGRKSYILLKNILSTNTLLSKLAVAYRLHEGLNDSFVSDYLKCNYVPHMDQWKGPCELDNEIIKYEQEFIGDYFECYVGALFLENPKIAQQWVTKIYENILLLINESYKRQSSLVQYNYKAWCYDVIGRII